MEDEEFLKMATVKKAYAEIILNTSKEAAARIMVADRRALCFEKELFALKQDALRMLVQLKQTLDSKNAEAEFRSANHQKKIKELEAQLSEAEGIILDLRDDLKLAQYKLEKQKQPSKQQNIISQNGHKEYLSSENKCSTKKTDETHHRVKSGREQCSSCSSESDEKDTKSSCYGSEAKLLEYEGHYIKDGRDGFRRTRKNVKYREAVAALRGCSRGRRSRSCQLPSFPRCSRTYSMNHNNDTAVEKSSEILVNESDFRSDVGPLKLKPSTVDDSNLHVQISEGKSTEGDSDKALKFTFQRKRKRVLSKLDNNIAPDGNKEGYPAKLQKTMVNDELAKDCQQLLQVAHQLIALSGNDPS